MRKEEIISGKKFGISIANIMRLCQVATEADLTPAWLELAHTSTKQHRSIIQQFVDTTSDDITDGLIIITTPSLVKKITTFKFVMHNMQSLESGVHPFIFNEQHTE